MQLVSGLRFRLAACGGFLRRRLMNSIESQLKEKGGSNAEIRAIRRAVDIECAENDPDAALASAHKHAKRKRINPVLWQLVLGTCDEGSGLHVFKHNYDILELVSNLRAVRPNESSRCVVSCCRFGCESSITTPIRFSSKVVRFG